MTDSDPGVPVADRDPRAVPWRPRAVALLALAAVPWTVIVYPGGVQLVFPWGTATLDPLYAVLLPDQLAYYRAGLRSLPPRLLVWPLATLSYAVALASAALARIDREDPRVTAGALALAAVAHLRMTLGLVRIGETALPVGPALAFVLAWWWYVASSGRR